MKKIDFRSDTVTRPTAGMMAAMMSAQVGDDVLGTDPTVTALEEKAAALFGKEASVFCPSGTMTNQIALQVNCQRLEEVVCHSTAHIYLYETGGYASNGGIPIKVIDTPSGKLSPEDVHHSVNGDFDWLPKTALFAIENTSLRPGGLVYSYDEMKAIGQACRANGLKYHLDGARIFNALVEMEQTPADIGPLFDTISICMSKGLGAPVGSLLLGSTVDMKLARRLRKAMGGGMRQSGYLAAACIYALDHHVDRLKEDHDKAQLLKETLESLSWVSAIKPVETNMVIFSIYGMDAPTFTKKMAEAGILCAGMNNTWVRFVTHLDVSIEDVEMACQRLQSITL